MAFETWANVLNPAFIPSGPYARLATEVGRQLSPTLQAARAANPRAFSFIPGSGGVDYLALSPVEAWNVIMANADLADNVEPNLDLPAGTPLDWGSIVTISSFGTPTTVSRGRFAASPGPPAANLWTPLRSGVRLDLSVAGRFQWVIDASDFDGTPLTVPVSDNYGFATSSPIRLDVFQLFTVEGSTATPTRSQGVGVTPAAGEFAELVPITIPVPAIPGLAPFPADWPYIVIEPARLPVRPVPILPAPTLPEPLRRALPPIFVFPDGIQVGINDATDRITVIPGDLLNRYPAPQTEAPLWPVPPAVGQCLEIPEPPTDCCDCEEIREIVKEELDSKFPPSRPNSVNSIVYGPAQSGVIDLPQFTERIRIQLIDYPVNARQQDGVDAPDVYYAGWFSLGAGGTGGVRTPIHYLSHNIDVPVGCDTFDYTCYLGFSAQITVFYRVEV